MKKNFVYMSIMLFVILSFVLLMTYSYYVPILKNPTIAADKMVLSNKGVTINYNNGSGVYLDETNKTVTKEITIKNNSDSFMRYYIGVDNVTNNLIDSQNTIISYTCTTIGGSCYNYGNKILPSNETSISTIQLLPPVATHTYYVTFMLLDDHSAEENFSGIVNVVNPNILKDAPYGTTDGFYQYKTDITEIIFENKINIPEGVTSFDSAMDNDNRVSSYIIDDGLGNNTYKLYIQADGNIHSWQDASNLFNGFSKLISISNMNYFNTSNSIRMTDMFSENPLLETLDLSNFDTSNTTHINYLFSGNTNINSLNLSNLDTSKVERMDNLFYNCSNLTDLNIASINTRNATDLSFMFYGCSSLSNININHFNTSNVTDMSYLFANCNSVVNLDLSTLNTNNLINTYYMFSNCNNLASLNLSNFNSSKIINMNSMFANCSSLVNLDLSSFITTSTTGMVSLFSGCSSLNNLNIRNMIFDTVVYHYDMFRNAKEGINIIVKDTNSQAFINSRLSEFSAPNGTVTIYIP